MACGCFWKLLSFSTRRPTYIHTSLCRYTSALKSVARVEKPLQSECYNQFMNSSTLHYVSAFSTFRYVHTKAHINIKLQRGFYIGMEVWFTTKIMMNANKFKLLHFWLWWQTSSIFVSIWSQRFFIIKSNLFNHLKMRKLCLTLFNGVKVLLQYRLRFWAKVSLTKIN